ncbi:SIS domain-containing protein [Propionicicella superfundia]|uniref:SIS domain-containing protein n=1 Tax=Propionicicella superfundia TaxID=348582 RepID=UPI0004144919|nr:SIS domain-containing protein [Propionicicella superfundia]
MDFDDGRLDDPVALTMVDARLRDLASAGARLRIEAEAAQGPIAALTERDRPRAVLALGTEARFLRAVLEPGCPVPFVAWQEPTLPGWVGPLDIVVVLGAESRLVPSLVEAVRRGCQVILSCPPGAPGGELIDARSTLLPATTADPLAMAIVMLSALHGVGLAPFVHVQSIADALDGVAEACSVHADLVSNPAKVLASELADALPLVFGTSVLSARAARRVAEGLRSAGGRVALAADARELLPVVEGTPARDLFADPFEEHTDTAPVLLFLDDGLAEPSVHVETLLDAAEARDVRVSRIARSENSAVERYATMLQEGLFAATYLRVGLGRDAGGPTWHNRRP